MHDQQCEKFNPGRDFMGPTISRCQNQATETVLDPKDKPWYLCEGHVNILWHEGYIKRNPKHYPVDPSQGS